MAEAAKDQDQSMEDILQSIKRIIAEEGDPVPAPAADVLELTDMLAEDGSLTKANSGGAIPTMSIEEIMAAPIASGAAPEPVAEPVAEAIPEPVFESMPVAEISASTPAPALASSESLISDEALSASVSALNALRDSMTAAAPRPAPSGVDIAFRSGTTVEDLVREALKPMLKEWLDSNLPALVESLVKKEISKLTQ
jgi:cell pole-organizing protein PopZ